MRRFDAFSITRAVGPYRKYGNEGQDSLGASIRCGVRCGRPLHRVHRGWCARCGATRTDHGRRRRRDGRRVARRDGHVERWSERPAAGADGRAGPVRVHRSRSRRLHGVGLLERIRRGGRARRRGGGRAAGFDTRRVVLCTIAFPTGSCVMAPEVECPRAFGGWWDGRVVCDQRAVAHVVTTRVAHGTGLPYPDSSGVQGLRHGQRRERRSQCGGRPIRVFYAVDPRRSPPDCSRAHSWCSPTVSRACSLPRRRAVSPHLEA